MPPNNILMICSDQHAARVTGAYGDRVVATPHLDALAAQGCRFDSCYCTDPVCVPSRMSFMTGRYPFRCESIGNQSVLDSRYPTLAHIAVRGGYHAVLSGKMHFNGPDQRHGFLERLVGETSALAYYGGADRGHEGPPFCHLGNCSRPDSLLHVGPGDNPLVAYDAAVTEATVAWLQRYAGTSIQRPPFFLMTGFMLPHCPFIAPRPLFDKYSRRVTAPRQTPAELAALHRWHRAYRSFIQLDDVPPENFHRAAAAYYALVELLDRNVGAIIEALKRTGLWESTVVAYFADHGEMLGQHGRWHKEAFYEGAARVPLIVRDPSRRLVPTVAEHRSLVDLMPTLGELVGVAPPPLLDGTSLLPVMTGAPPDADRAAKVESYSYWDHGDWSVSANRMVRRGPWKVCYYGDDTSWELFNLADDPGETRDLSALPEYATVLRDLQPLVFADGWSAATVRELDARLNAMGHQENMRAFRDALRTDPLPIDRADYWRAFGATRTRVEPA